MAEHTTKQQSEQQGGGAGPRVYPAGRISAPVSEVEDPQKRLPAEGAELPSEMTADDAEGAESEAGQAEGDRSEHSARAYLQRRRRKLLHDCERLLLLDFDTLAIPSWPDHHRLSQARKRRDTWLMLVAVLAVPVLAGMGNLVPAVIGGVAFGLLVLCGLWGVPAVRHVFSTQPSCAELLLKRRRMLQRARKHVQHLEGRNALAACCRGLAEYNPALRRSRFQGLYRLSERGQLVRHINSRAQAQLYLIFALEAEKAYNRLREAYLSAYQQELDAGEAQPLDARSEASAAGEVLQEVSGDEPPEEPLRPESDDESDGQSAAS